MLNTNSEQSNPNYAQLAQRAYLLLERSGGRASEEALIREVFNIRVGNKLEVWSAILAQVLADSHRFRRLPQGDWGLTVQADTDSALLELEYVVIDCETTGLNPQRQRVTEVGAIRLRGGQRIESFQTLINPHCRIPDYISKFTGITNEMTASAPGFGRIADKLREFIGTSIIVGHNIPFDIRFLDWELRRLHYPPLLNETVDTISLTLRLYPGMKRPNLDRLAALVGLPTANRHRAFGDASITADAFLILLQKAAERGYKTLADLRTGRPSVKTRSLETNSSNSKFPLTVNLPKPSALTLFEMPLPEEDEAEEAFETETDPWLERDAPTKIEVKVTSGCSQEDERQNFKLLDTEKTPADPVSNHLSGLLVANPENGVFDLNLIDSSSPSLNHSPETEPIVAPAGKALNSEVTTLEFEAEQDLGSSITRPLQLPRRPRYKPEFASLTNRATARARHVLSKDLLKDLPSKPGVYLMKDAGGTVIYVGKAKNLRDRVSSYYSQPLGYTRKMDGLVESINRIDHIEAGSELEALLLESKLIKRYLPRYNSQQRNYESYPFIKIDLSQRFPRIYSCREVCDDGARYFGPFKSRRAVDTTVEIIEQLFPVRTCTRSFEWDTLNRKRKMQPPCLRLSIGRCPGPCTGEHTDQNHQQYMKIIDDVTAFLAGEKQSMLDTLWNQIQKAATNRDFERAANLRDAYQQVEKIIGTQKFLAAAVEGNNVLIALPSVETGAVEILFIYRGRLGCQMRLSFSVKGFEELIPQLDQAWQNLVEREASLASTQPSWGKSGGRVIGQEAVDEINIIARWLYNQFAQAGVEVETANPIDSRLILQIPQNPSSSLFWFKAIGQIKAFFA